MTLEALDHEYRQIKKLACQSTELKFIQVNIKVVVWNKGYQIPGLKPVEIEEKLYINPLKDMVPSPRFKEDIFQWKLVFFTLLHDCAEQLGACYEQHQNFFDYFHLKKKVTFKLV
ncbi:MAG: hypothetical protein CMF61_01570 [Magnetococcales bacterium]|nr:hypothetical protein [Magnetococcales bacterium]PPR19718.1 MAG: hypothetical protein CFH43_00039 [Pseudomonadota bacterium]|tara:strand:+ start:942 stop:1286 length:345 start_codon:yes stop_codon:yes gene_type:complete